MKMKLNEEWENFKWKLAFISRDGITVLPTGHVFKDVPEHSMEDYEDGKIVSWKQSPSKRLEWIKNNELVDFVPDTKHE